MHINILTFVKVNSFGATLQCYALSKVLQEIGHKVEIIDFRLPPKRTSILGRLADLIPKYLFSKFNARFIPNFTRYFESGEALASNPPSADCYIVGSDQVWNTDITKELATSFFLDFVPSGKRRIAYAASFGTERWEPTNKDSYINNCLSQFDAIAVREESGLKILNDHFHREAEVVLDPTLLLSSYDELLSTGRKNSGELISYRLTSNAEYLQLLMPISKRLGLSPVLLNERRMKKGFKYRPFVGVEAWLQSLSNASFIVTDSFHCMVFAIIFRKNFIVIPSHPGRTTRLTGLLRKLGMEDRFYPSLSVVDMSKALVPIEYGMVFKNLETERAASILYLTKALVTG